jgi:predicted transcriptional regulator of viral defense system
MAHLQSQGRFVFSGQEAQKALGVSRGAFLDAAEKRQRSRQLISPRRDFYVIVPPQYLSSGAPPPAWYIDALMKHVQQPYYVGLLTAAGLRGASAEAATEFQVVTAMRLPEIRLGRTVVAFYYRKDMNTVASATEQRTTDTGSMNVSSPELTALDLLRYPSAGGGFDAVAKVLSQLGSHLDPDKLATLSAAFERSVVQRLGYLLSKLEHVKRAKSLHRSLLTRSPLPWVELEPAQAADEQHGSSAPERDQTWRVIVRRASWTQP